MAKKVLVFTEYRGVVFGSTDDPMADPIKLSDARMCLRWSRQVGGVFGLAEKGPFDASESGDTTVSAPVKSLSLSKITGVAELTDAAIQAWESAPVAGR